MIKRYHRMLAIYIYICPRWITEYNCWASVKIHGTEWNLETRFIGYDVNVAYIDFAVRWSGSLCMIKMTQFGKKVFTGESPMHPMFPPICFRLDRFTLFLPNIRDIPFRSVACPRVEVLVAVKLSKSFFNRCTIKYFRVSFHRNNYV